MFFWNLSIFCWKSVFATQFGSFCIHYTYSRHYCSVQRKKVLWKRVLHLYKVEWLISDGDQWISVMKTKTWFNIIMWIKLHLIDHKILDSYVQLFRLCMCYMDKHWICSWFYTIRRFLIFGRKIINIRLKPVLLNVLELRYLEFTLLYIFGEFMTRKWNLL